MAKLIKVVPFLSNIVSYPIKKRYPGIGIMGADEHEVTCDQNDRIGESGVPELLKSSDKNNQSDESWNNFTCPYNIIMRHYPRTNKAKTEK
jgi:hypothetical protein